MSARLVRWARERLYQLWTVEPSFVCLSLVSFPTNLHLVGESLSWGCGRSPFAVYKDQVVLMYIPGQQTPLSVSFKQVNRPSSN